MTKFILRHQCRRQLDPLDLSHLWSKLPRLEEIWCEPWQLLHRDAQQRQEEEYAVVINRFLPTSIKKVTIFEDLNEKYLGLLQRRGWPRMLLVPAHPRGSMHAVGAAFAARSLQLEHFSVAFLADACDFFDNCQSHWRWNRLRSLTLTSWTISKTTARETNRLLKRAALIALKMPKLEKMVLWNWSIQEACSFTYCHGDDTSLVWKGTWDLGLEDEVLDAWKAVVGVEVEKQLLTDDIRSHGDAIEYLGLQSVVDEVSLQQIRAENNLV
ncbi:hypothetical protein ACHAP5_005481 [Fusarium lateritium]